MKDCQILYKNGISQNDLCPPPLLNLFAYEKFSHANRGTSFSRRDSTTVLLSMTIQEQQREPCKP
jgi:hypothetical protein